MAVVINEFQLLAEPPSAPARSDEGAREATPPPSPDRCELPRLLRAEEVRALRVWAH